MLDAAFVLGVLGGPVCYAFGFTAALVTTVPRPWRRAIGAVTGLDAASMLTYLWLWSRGFAAVDTADERGPSAVENGFLLATGTASAAVVVLASWCLLRFRGHAPAVADTSLPPRPH